MKINNAVIEFLFLIPRVLKTQKKKCHFLTLYRGQIGHDIIKYVYNSATAGKYS